MAVHGKKAYIAIDNSSGTLVDISSEQNEAGLSRALDTAESTGFSPTGGAKKYVAGLEDGTIEISGFFDATQDALIHADIAALAAGTLASITVEYAPQGNASGNVKYSQEAIITSYEVSAQVGDLVSATLSLQRTGPSTRSTI